MKMENSLKHIGIVACSAEGAALCYKTICTESPKVLGKHVHPEVSMHTHSLADYIDCLDSGDLPGVAELMLSSAQKLKMQGADFLICPDNTIHQALEYIENRLPLPWLHIADVVVESAGGRGFQQLGILGTKWLVESSVYPEKIERLGLLWKRPDEEERAEMNRIIMEELVYGIFKPGSIAFFQAVIKNLKALDCDAVILGCTEIPLIIDDTNSELPTLNSNRLLAEAAITTATR